ncbi:MAG: poly-beta-1,6-N-acetyl-D-glucosamine biosynthesis protein PgaD [Gammaproteobacteria bacterium]|nr:poly-beta-1,6-N-acetyl-D-glucosamine biosynthesis protein PgaD [Gammaproteobacteria bacterium]
MSNRRESEIFINAPGLRHRHRRAGDQLLTLIMWAIYAYLWLPVISLIAWFVGIDLFYQEMVVDGGFDAFIELSGWYLAAIVLIVLAVGGWSTSNYFRFHDKNRRRKQPEVSDADIAEWFQVDKQKLDRLRAAEHILLVLDEKGLIDQSSDI